MWQELSIRDTTLTRWTYNYGTSRDEVREVVQLERIKNEALDREIAQRMENIVDKTGQKLTRCTVCGKTFKQKSKAKFHIETHIEGFSHTCNICGATAKTKKSLSVHIYNRHTKTNKQQE